MKESSIMSFILLEDITDQQAMDLCASGIFYRRQIIIEAYDAGRKILFESLLKYATEIKHSGEMTIYVCSQFATLELIKHCQQGYSHLLFAHSALAHTNTRTFHRPVEEFQYADQAAIFCRMSFFKVNRKRLVNAMADKIASKEYGARWDLIQSVLSRSTLAHYLDYLLITVKKRVRLPKIPNCTGLLYEGYCMHLLPVIKKHFIIHSQPAPIVDARMIRDLEFPIDDVVYINADTNQDMNELNIHMIDRLLMARWSKVHDAYLWKLRLVQQQRRMPIAQYFLSMLLSDGCYRIKQDGNEQIRRFFAIMMQLPEFFQQLVIGNETYSRKFIDTELRTQYKFYWLD